MIILLVKVSLRLTMLLCETGKFWELGVSLRVFDVVDLFTDCVGSDKQAVYADGCDNVNCHDWSKHEVDELLVCYVAMFKDLCKFICTTNAMRAHVHADPDSQLWSLVKEGALSDLNQYDSVDEDEDSDNPEFLLEHLNSENIDQETLVDESQPDDSVMKNVMIRWYQCIVMIIKTQ